MRAAAEGQPLEAGHAIDEQGAPTTDAAAALRGAQLPVGGAKGFGLGLMVDMLAGVLTGSNCSFEASMFANEAGGPPNVGQAIIAMDPAFFSTDYLPHLDAMLTALTQDNDVRIPGERRAGLRATHAELGVEVAAKFAGYHRCAFELNGSGEPANRSEFRPVRAPKGLFFDPLKIAVKTLDIAATAETHWLNNKNNNMDIC